MKTLLLDRDAWDLVLDANGNIAMAGAPYSIAQDVASAIRTFLGECWYDGAQGLPYWLDILGHYPPLQYVRQKITDAAMSIPNVAEVKVLFVDFTGRALTGQVQIIDKQGKESGVSF